MLLNFGSHGQMYSLITLITYFNNFQEYLISFWVFRLFTKSNFITFKMCFCVIVCVELKFL